MAFLSGDEFVEIDGKVYHSDDACAGTMRRRALGGSAACRRRRKASAGGSRAPTLPPRERVAERITYRWTRNWI